LKKKKKKKNKYITAARENVQPREEDLTGNDWLNPLETEKQRGGKKV
jgi:hypothetical protein